MSVLQKIIKYLSIAFAISLIASIFMFSYNIILYFVDDKEQAQLPYDTVKYFEVEGNPMVLDVELGYAQLNITQGEKFVIYSNNEKINYIQKKNTIYIKDSKNLFKSKDDYKIDIIIPYEYIFNEVEIDTGSGFTSIDGMKTNKLELDFDAGKSEINNLEVIKNASISTGAGKTIIKNSILTNSDIELGIGEFYYDGKLLVNNEIECGVGKTTINLNGLKEEYKIKVNSGIGKININDLKVSDGTVFGDGNNNIRIDGGIGIIDIKFNE